MVDRGVSRSGRGVKKICSIETFKISLRTFNNIDRESEPQDTIHTHIHTHYAEPGRHMSDLVEQQRKRSQVSYMPVAVVLISHAILVAVAIVTTAKKALTRIGKNWEKGTKRTEKMLMANSSRTNWSMCLCVCECSA